MNRSDDKGGGGEVQSSFHHLTDEERLKVAIQVDYFIQQVERRYGVSVNEMVETIKWAQDHRSTMKQIGRAGVLTVLGILLTGIAAAIWSGVIDMIKHGHVKE